MTTALKSTSDLKKLSSNELYSSLRNTADKLSLIESHIGRIERIRKLYGTRGPRFNNTRAILFGIFSGSMTGLLVHSAAVGIFYVIVSFIGVALLCSYVLIKLHERGYRQINEAMHDFDNELNNIDDVLLSIIQSIPEKYRISIILYKFCEYLSDGEVDSWPKCIARFKDDEHRMKQEQNLDEIINNLQAIKANTRAAAMFAGWNTLK